tara:strand:- start:4110 stop:4364 length:255 start_codon:yes stop_codon:yes gene_type:complete
MSYILTVSSSISTPVSIANGGTSAITAPLAMTALSSGRFSSSAQSGNWGVTSVDPPTGLPDPAVTQQAVIDVISALEGMGVLGA